MNDIVIAYYNNIIKVRIIKGYEKNISETYSFYSRYIYTNVNFICGSYELISYTIYTYYLYKRISMLCSAIVSMLNKYKLYVNYCLI